MKLKQTAQKVATLQNHITLLEKELAAEVKENKQMSAELNGEMSVITASLSDEEKFYQGRYRYHGIVAAVLYTPQTLYLMWK